MQPTHNMIVKSSRSLCGTGVLALLLSASVAQAAVSITGNYAGATAPTIDNTYGTLEFALNMGGPAIPDRDGIAFTTAGTTPSGAVRTFLSNGGVGATIDVVGTSTGPGWSTHSFGGDTLFHSIAYVDSNGGYTIDLTDLDASKSYQLQFLFGDPRSDFPYNGRTVTVSDLLPSPNTATAILTYGSSSPTDQFAMLTAVVSGSTSFQFISPVSGTGSGAPLLSGVVVHSIPEPSAALLGGLGLLGLLARRRRA